MSEKNEFTKKQTDIMSQALFDLLFNVGNFMGVSTKMNDKYIEEKVADYMDTVKESVKLQTAFENVRNEDK